MKKSADKIYHVNAAEAGQTLAACLRKWLTKTSWGEAERLLQTRRVMVNGNLCLDAGRRLKTAEVVKILEHSAAKLPEENDVVIRHLDAHLVIVEKPSGMTSLRHNEERQWPSRRKQLQPTLDELLPRIVAKRSSKKPLPKSIEKPSGRAKSHKKNVPDTQPAAKTPIIPLRAVHRLDRETSGLMVFARTVTAERGLGEQFRKHSIHRCYWAVVQGKVETQTISHRLIRDRGDGRRGITNSQTEGKHAVTHIKPLQFLNGFTLVECRLETGRTHQIRLHLAAQGHPVCGEKIYHQPLRGQPFIDKSGAPRLALHAAELGFIHPVTNQEIKYQMDFPPDLKELVARLQNR